MRRQDREITDSQKIKDIIQSCECCHVGFIEEDGAYIVPLNFAYDDHENERVFYFHGAKEGKKIDLASSQPFVGFELDTNHHLLENEKACGYSFRFQSVIGKGQIFLVSELEEKREALQLIMQHYTQKNDWEFPEQAIHNIAVMKLVVSKLSCKEHL